MPMAYRERTDTGYPTAACLPLHQITIVHVQIRLTELSLQPMIDTQLDCYLFMCVLSIYRY